jgi:hypothetical protein
MIQKNYRKGWMYSVAYAYPSSTNAGKMKKARDGAWYIEYAKDRITPGHIFMGPFDTKNQAQAELKNLPIRKGNPNGGNTETAKRKKTTAKRTTKKKAVRRVAKKTVVKRTPTQIRYWIVAKYRSNILRYYDGIHLTPISGEKAYFDSLEQATKVARRIVTQTDNRFPISVHSNKSVKKK